MQSGSSNNPPYANYTWTGVIEFLQDQVKNLNMKQNEDLLEKQQLQSKINKLEGELKAHEAINLDLMKRIKMLEFCLRQERIKYAKLNPNVTKILAESSSKLNQDLSSINLNINPDNIQIPSIPRRRVKSQRPLLLKYLEQLGYDDIFPSVNESEETPKDDMIKEPIPSSNHQRNITMIKGNLDVNMNRDKFNEEYASIGHNSTVNLNQIKNNNNNSNNVNEVNESKFNSSIANDLNPKKPTITSTTATSQPPLITTTPANYVEDDQSRLDALNDKKNIKKIPETSTIKKTKVVWEEANALRSHFDGIRGLFIPANDAFLCTISEDCMVKIWDLKGILKHNEENDDAIEPYFTLREHTGPLFSITGSRFDLSSSKSDLNYIYTAGSEGIIRAWNMPLPGECDQYKGLDMNKNYCVGAWNAHDESIWELAHHPFKHLLLSSSADGNIKLWETVNNNNGQLNNQPNGKVKASYWYKIQGGSDDDYLIPTSITWIQTNLHTIAAGYANSNNILLIDEETGKVVSTFKFGSSTSTKNLTTIQPNKLYSHPNMNIIISGHEDSHIRIFDINSNKQIQAIKAHGDSVTALDYNKASDTLLSASHDGSVKAWDMKRYICMQEIKDIHYRKYDECINTILCHENLPFFGTGGADGVVKIFHQMNF